MMIILGICGRALPLHPTFGKAGRHVGLVSYAPSHRISVIEDATIPCQLSRTTPIKSPVRNRFQCPEPAAWKFCLFFKLQHITVNFPCSPPHRRLLRPGGVCAMGDHDPQSKVILGLPPVIATLMKSTEPYTSAYHDAPVERLFERAGFHSVESKPLNPRHKTILGRVPS